MLKLKIEKTDNLENRAEEVSKIVEIVAKKISWGETHGTCFNTQGEEVGRWEFSRDDYGYSNES